MTRTQLKQLIRECIKEVNESFGEYQGSFTLSKLASFLKRDVIIRRKNVDVDLNSSGDTITLTNDNFPDLYVAIKSAGKNKYRVGITSLAPDSSADNPLLDDTKYTITDMKGVLRLVHNYIKYIIL